MKSVQVEHQQNQALITAHRMQLETEDHIYRLALSEKSRVKQEMQQLNKTFTELGDRHNILQNDIFRHTENLERLKASVKWDKDALMAWEEELARGDENNNLLQRYVSEDEGKAKELELKRQRLRMDVEMRRNIVDNIVGEVFMLEQALDQTAQMFRRVHHQRQEEIRQWEDSVRILHQREREINRAIEEISMIRAHVREKNEEKEEEKRFYENEVSNNREMDRQIAATTRESKMQNDANEKLMAMVDELRNELVVVQRTLTYTGNKLAHKRSQNKRLQEEIQAKKKRVAELDDLNGSLKNKYASVENGFMTASERAKQIEEMVQAEERMVDILNQDCARVLQMHYRAQQELFELTSQEELQEVDIKAIQSSKSLIEKQAEHLDDEIQRQKEIIYTMDFETQRLESRIAHMTGDRGIEEREANEKKLAELEEAMTEKTATYNLLNSQVTFLEDTMRRLTAGLAADSMEHKRLKDRRQDQMLLVDGGHKQLDNSRRINMERQVEENVLKLRVKQLEQALAREGGAVYSLECQRLELESAMKERQVEIGVHADLLKTQKRALNEEKSRLQREIQERHIKISQLQKKHDIAVLALGTGEDGEQLSITHLKIKSAQEKYMLQEEGDELDAKIRRAEKEIQAMENTLKVVNASNDTYRKNLATVDKDSPEYLEKKELDGQYYVAIDRLRSRRSELNDRNTDIEEMEHTLNELLSTEDDIRAAWRDKDQQAADLHRELQEQQTKLQRADKQLRKLIKELRGIADPKMLTTEEKDINVRELQEQNGSALQQLAELVARRMETGPVVTRYLQEKGLALPVTRSSLTASSSRSKVLTASTGTTPTASSSRVSLSREGSLPSIVMMDPLQLQAESSKKSLGSDASKKRKSKKK